jgi:hypothetical protein
MTYSLFSGEDQQQKGQRIVRVAALSSSVVDHPPQYNELGRLYNAKTDAFVVVTAAPAEDFARFGSLMPTHSSANGEDHHDGGGGIGGGRTVVAEPGLDVHELLGLLDVPLEQEVSFFFFFV